MSLIQPSDTLARTVRRTATGAVLLGLGAVGTATAHGTGSGPGSTMGGGGWGIAGGTMGLWGPLWVGLVLAVSFLVGYSFLDRETEDERSSSVLRERYARGELSDEEFERRRERLERTG